MNEIKKIIIKVSILLLDIFYLGWATIKNIVLPGRKKKGNILSSLFIFFVGLIERLNGFEHGIFCMARILKQKYIKQSLLIVAGFLFLLSSVEWSDEKNIHFPFSNYTEQQLPNPEVKTIVAHNGNPATINLLTSPAINVHAVTTTFFQTHSPFHPSVKSYLLIHCFRI